MGPRLSSCLDKPVDQPHKIREGAILVAGFSHLPGPAKEWGRNAKGEEYNSSPSSA
jgi:hypothetical protein